MNIPITVTDSNLEQRGGGGVVLLKKGCTQFLPLSTIPPGSFQCFFLLNRSQTANSWFLSLITSPPAPKKQLQQMKVKCSVIWNLAINEGKYRYSTYRGSLWQNLEGCLVHPQEATESTQCKLDMYDEKENHAEMKHKKTLCT